MCKKYKKNNLSPISLLRQAPKHPQGYPQLSLTCYISLLILPPPNKVIPPASSTQCLGAAMNFFSIIMLIALILTPNVLSFAPRTLNKFTSRRRLNALPEKLSDPASLLDGFRSKLPPMDLKLPTELPQFLPDQLPPNLVEPLQNLVSKATDVGAILVDALK